MHSIRPLNTDESPNVYEALGLLFKEMYDFMRELGLSNDLTEGGEKIWVNSLKPSLSKLNAVFVAFYKGEMIGFAAGNVRISPAFLGSKKNGYVSHVYVRSTHRRSSIGKQLVDNLESWLYSKAVDGIFLEVLGNNQNAIEFWESRGYALDSTNYFKIA